MDEVNDDLEWVWLEKLHNTQGSVEKKHFYIHIFFKS